MPIEDVDFLKKRSKKQNYVFLVDSKERDRYVNPNPNEYIVRFDVPFNNVVGLEVLEATIPRTMYNVDKNNNTIRFGIYKDRDALTDCEPWTSCIDYVTREVPIGDYSIQTLVPALNAVLVGDVQGASPAVQAAITARPLSNPPDARNTLVFTCPYPFVLDMASSTIAETLGFDLHVAPAEASEPVETRRYSIVSARSDPKLYASVDREYPAVGPESTVFDGPRGILRSTAVTPTRWVAQKWRAPFDGFLVGLDVALTTDTQEQMDEGILWQLYEHDAVRGAPGAQVAGAQGSIAISQVDGGFSDAIVNTAGGGIRVTGNRDYWVVLRNNDNDTRPAKVFYNDVPATETTLLVSEGATTDAATSRTWHPVADANDVYYNMSLRVRIAEPYHRIEAPGLVSLVGERFVTLRCPEIEDNMLRSLTYGRMGLAKLRLGVMGFSENRVDFNKIALREFHPIGKLARMTLRFERGDGELYDFKGVNHTIVFALHYYEPVQVEQFARSVLNPNYTGNFHDYARFEAEQEEDSDDQSIDYNEDQDTFAMWRLMQQRNLPEQRLVQDMDVLRRLRLDGEDDGDDDGEDNEDDGDDGDVGDRAGATSNDGDGDGERTGYSEDFVEPSDHYRNTDMVNHYG